MENKKRIECGFMDREVAILIYKGILYEDINHQFALQLALTEDKENYLALDENLRDFNYVDASIDLVAKQTMQLNKECKISCLDHWQDDDCGYITAHTKEALDIHSRLIEEYAKKNNLKIGYFEKLSDDFFFLV